MARGTVLIADDDTAIRTVLKGLTTPEEVARICQAMETGA